MSSSANNTQNTGQVDVLEQEHADFIEKMGLMSQREGLPRISGRILGLLIITGKAYSFNDIAALLQISRGSVSTNTRLLENLSIIQRSAKTGERQDYFELRKHPYKALMRSMQTRIQSGIEMVSGTIDVIDKKDTDTRARLQELQDFYESFYACTKDLS